MMPKPGWEIRVEGVGNPLDGPVRVIFNLPETDDEGIAYRVYLETGAEVSFDKVVDEATKILKARMEAWIEQINFNLGERE